MAWNKKLNNQQLKENVDINTIGAAINGAASATPNNTDLVMSVENSVAKKNTWTQIKAFLKTYFDTIYQAAGSYLTSANITQVITNGVTDKAPSEDAVFDALALKQNSLGYTAEDSANKSSSFTVSSTTTYANTKALVDGLATKQGTLTLTTTGTSGLATLSGGTLNIPKYVDGDWVDYSATSTIVGWSSFTTKVIKYRIIGKQIFFIIDLDGTSNSTSTTFTMPNNTINSILTYAWSKNNGVSNSTSLIYTAANSNIMTCYNGASSTWTASGSKGFQCQFFIVIA